MDKQRFVLILLLKGEQRQQGHVPVKHMTIVSSASTRQADDTPRSQIHNSIINSRA